jgi:hypothetical protein
MVTNPKFNNNFINHVTFREIKGDKNLAYNIYCVNYNFFFNFFFLKKGVGELFQKKKKKKSFSFFLKGTHE